MKLKRPINEALRKHLQSIKSQLSSSKNLIKAIIKARAEININDYDLLIDGLNDIGVNHRLLVFPLPKRELHNLFRYRPIQRLPLIKEMEWQFLSLLNYINKLETYIAFNRAIENLWLQNDLSDISRLIDESEIVLGKSLRFTELRVSLWKETDQTQSIQDFFEKVKNDSNMSGLATALIALVIERNEDEVYLPRYIYRMETFLQDADFILSNLIRFCIAHVDPKSDDGWSALISSIATGGIVDAYEALLECCNSKVNQIISSAKESSAPISKDEENFLKRIFKYASQFGSMGDARFNEIIYKIKLSQLILTEQELQMAECISKLDFSEFIRGVCYDESPNDALKYPEFWNKFWSSSKRIVDREDNFEHEAYNLIKYSINNQHLSFAEALGVFGFSNITKTKSYSSSLALANKNPTSKIYLLSISSAFELFDPSRWSSLVFKYAHLAADDVCPDDLNDFELTALSESLLIKLDLNKLTIPEAISELERVPLNKAYLKNQINKMRFNQALEDSDYVSAIKIVCSSCIGNTGRTKEFDLHNLVGQKDWDFFEPMSNSIIIPVVLYLYLLEYENPDANFNLRLSIDEFLMCNECHVPSALIERADYFDGELLIFFLDYVCTNEYLEFVTSLNQTRLIEEERREILKWLVVKNPKRRSDYEDEIKGISARLTVDDGLKEFDRSRVHVDLLGIYKWAEKHLTEDYDRLQTLIRTNSNVGLDTYRLLEQAILDPTNITKVVLGGEKNPIEVQTLKIIRIIFDQFNNNKPYGLDTHLSLRIRHGSFRGYIRSVLELSSLISTKDKSTGFYMVPQVWKAGIEQVSETQRRQIQKAFDSFGRNVDSEIDQYINELIQIRTQEKSHGLFHIQMNELVLKVMSSSAISGISSKEFIDNCFLIYLSSLEQCLEFVREMIEHQFKPKMVGFIAELETTLRKACNDQLDPVRERSIADGRKQLIDVIDKVRDWFTFFDYRSTSKLFTLEEMADVAIAAVGNTRKGNSRHVTKDIDVYLSTVKVMSLETVVDPLFILLENAEKYGDVSEASPIQLKIKLIESPSSKIRLQVSNKLKDDEDIPELKARLSNLAEEIKSVGLNERLATEGGTGLVKLSKMGLLSRDKDVNETVSFEIEDTTRSFIASVDLDFRIQSNDE